MNRRFLATQGAAAFSLIGLLAAVPAGSAEISICVVDNPPEAGCNQPCPYPGKPDDLYYVHANWRPHWHTTNGTGNSWGHFHWHYCAYVNTSSVGSAR